MSLVVLGRPSMAAADRAWIDALRARHRGAVFQEGLGAHVTLVFPTDATDPTSATSHLATVAAETAPIELTFRATMPWLDRFSDETYVYLVPDAGNGALIRLARLPLQRPLRRGAAPRPALCAACHARPVSAKPRSPRPWSTT